MLTVLCSPKAIESAAPQPGVQAILPSPNGRVQTGKGPGTGTGWQEHIIPGSGASDCTVNVCQPICIIFLWLWIREAWGYRCAPEFCWWSGLHVQRKVLQWNEEGEPGGKRQYWAQRENGRGIFTKVEIGQGGPLS